MSVMLAVAHLIGLLSLTFALESSVPTPISCTTRGSDLTEDRSLVVCPSNCVVWQLPVFGSDVYAAVSSVCGAALHRGIITASGGQFRVQKVPGQENYLGSYSNGVKSQNLSKWTSSFSVYNSVSQPMEVSGHTTSMPKSNQAKKAVKKNMKKPSSNGNKDCQVDIAMLLDGSNNIGHRRFNLQKNFVGKLALMLRTGSEGPHLGVVQARFCRILNITFPCRCLCNLKEKRS